MKNPLENKIEIMRNIGISTKQQIVNIINAKIGFSYPEYNKGYIVGYKNLHSSKNPSLKYKDIYKDIDNFISNIPQNTTFGGWLNKDTSIYYVDISKVYTDIDNAIKEAKKNNQIAIWDAYNNKEILIK